MLRKMLMTAVILALVCVAQVQAAPPADSQMPATVDAYGGNPVLSYSLFGVTAFLAVLMVYRGIRAG